MKSLLQKHIKFEKLVSRAERILCENEVITQNEHLSVCADCSENLRKLENFLAYTSQNNLVESTPPQRTTANLLNVFQPKKNPTAKKSLAEKILGVLTFDDWLPEFAVNERLAYSDTRQMLFRASDFEIDLRLNFFGGKCQVSGQIFPDCNMSEGMIEISSESVGEKVFLNECCEFIFPFIEEGIYDLRLDLGLETIELTGVSLQS
jgi:hypothetical protein